MQKKDEMVKQICTALVSGGYITDYAYDHFREEFAVPPPFAVYRRVAASGFAADGVVYHRGDNVDLELYADTPEDMAALMDAVEMKLDEAELFYNITADTVYIEQENFYETLYEL